MARIFEMIPQGVAESVLGCQKPNTAAGDFDVVRATTVDVNQNGISKTIAINVPALEWEENECPTLLTGSGDEITGAQFTFDSSQGVFGFESKVFKDAVLNSEFVLFSSSTKEISVKFNDNDDTITFKIVNGGVTDTVTLVSGYDFRSTYEIGWATNDLTIKINTVLVYQQNTFVTFGASELTEVNLSDRAGTANFLLAKTNDVYVSDTKADMDTTYQSRTDLIDALTEYNAYTQY